MLIYNQSKIGLGSKIEMTLVSEFNEDYVEKIFRKLWIKLFEFEKRCSRFINDSELVMLNNLAGSKVNISREFRDALLASKKMSKFSSNLYNPFVLPIIQKNGYVSSMVTKYHNDTVFDYSDRKVVEPEALEVGEDWAKIPFGTAIDLGGCGKGYIGDELSKILERQSHIEGYWLSMGGDVIAAGSDENGKNWEVYIESMNGNKPYAYTIRLPSKKKLAVASSCPTRSSKELGITVDHIIDTRTNTPVKSDILLSTICADQCIKADVIASCVLIEGKENIDSYMHNLKGIYGGLLQIKNKPEVVKIGNLSF